jgi:hypothetical protein
MFGAKFSGIATMAAALIVAPAMVVTAAPAYGEPSANHGHIKLL